MSKTNISDKKTDKIEDNSNNKDSVSLEEKSQDSLHVEKDEIVKTKSEIDSESFDDMDTSVKSVTNENLKTPRKEIKENFGGYDNSEALGSGITRTRENIKSFS